MNIYQIFFAGYAVGCLTTVFINIVYHQYKIYKKNTSLKDGSISQNRSKRERFNQVGLALDKVPIVPLSIKAATISQEEQKKTSVSDFETLLGKPQYVSKDREVDDITYVSDYRDVEDITLDGSKPHRAYLLQKKSYLRVISVVILSVIFSFLLVLLRPDLFPFLKYSSVFEIFSKTFPENYNARMKDQQPQTIVPIVELSRNISHPQSTDNEQKPQNSQIYQNALRTANIESGESADQHAKNKGEYWYIIELQTGENIITQSAIENDGIITVWRPDGRERKFTRMDVKSVKKVMY